jgi:hypothetical protein
MEGDPNMGKSYCNQLLVAMGELLPGQFFLRWPCTEMSNGRRNGWLGPAC